MGKALISALVVIAVMATAPVATAATGEETYDLLFRNGTLDAIDRDAALVYRRDVTNTILPKAAERDTGQVAITFGAEDDSMARLEFRRDEKHKGLGRFPANVGNPMIMYFYESVIRDMAETAGGSPFYIRNRVKEALVQPADIETGEAILDGKTIATQTIRLYPFAGDPNQDRMRGFGDLVLSVTMSDAVPGWYVSLVAEAAPKGAAPVYRSELVFDRLEEVGQ